MNDAQNDGKTNDEIGKESADLMQDQQHVNADTRSADEVAADAKLGERQAPQDGSTNKELDTPDADKAPDPELRAPNAPVPDQDKQEEGNDSASHKPGEALGRTTSEQEAAEEDPASADKTNPVGEATQHESKDPYAEGKHVANPEPNNGKGDDPEAFDKAQEEREIKAREDADKASQTKGKE